MVCRAAVKIYDKRQDKEITIPCHRHCDAFLILKEFGYNKGEDYQEIEQGFLDEHNRFLTRIGAWWEAYNHHQLKETEVENYTYNEPMCRELYSEDLW